MFWNMFVDALNSLWLSRQRTLLSTIGVVIGSGSVIAMINVGQMVQKDAMQEFKKLGPDLIRLHLGNKTILYDIVDDLRNTLDGRPFITPVLTTFKHWVYSHSSGQTSIIGVDEDFGKVVGEQVAEGRFLGRLDGKELFAVLGSSALHVKGKDKAPQPRLMDQVQLKDVILQVVGKLKPYGTNPMLGFNIDTATFVPIGSFADSWIMLKYET